MKASNKAVGIGFGILIGMVAIGTGVSAYASDNPESALGKLIFSTSVVPSDETVTSMAINADGTVRPMTQDEIEAFKNFEVKDGVSVVEGNAISANGTSFMPVGSDSGVALVIEDDGTIREMTQAEQDQLNASGGVEFSASSEVEVKNGSFGN